MNTVTVKPGVEFATIAPGGFAILSAIQRACIASQVNLTITSGTDGEHSGPTDPHKRGEAYDIRTHGLIEAEKASVLSNLMGVLGWERFYAFVESPNTESEHLHVQIRKGTTYP